MCNTLFCPTQDIVDASEDSQMQEALKKSMEETQAANQPILPDLTDEESLSENDDLETFSDSDDDQKVSGTPVKKLNTNSGIKSGLATNGSKSPTTTQTADSGDSVMGKQCETLDKACLQETENGKSSAKTAGESSSASDDDKSCERPSTWRNYLGCPNGTKKNNSQLLCKHLHNMISRSMFYVQGIKQSYVTLCILDPESKLQIRFPDGRKEQLNIPSSSKLMVRRPQNDFFITYLISRIVK